jgi:ABC-2 type transport system permease protein
MRNILLIIKREYFTRVKNKWFWVLTFLVPLGIVVLTVTPMFLERFAGRSEDKYLVIDKTGGQFEFLKNVEDERFEFEFVDVGKQEAMEKLEEREAIALIRFNEPEELLYEAELFSKKTISISKVESLRGFLHCRINF